MLHHFELDQLLLVLLLITVALFSYYVGRRASIRYTTLPELRFNFRRLVIDNVHSSSCSTPRTYPRTDLARFEPWQTFATDIRTAIMDAMETRGVAVGTTITFGGVFEEQEELVANEQDVHQTADTELHKAAIKVLKALGAPGRFYRSGTGPIEIIGVPDFCWIHAGTRHPKLVEEFKPEWVADLRDLPASLQAFNTIDCPVPDKQCVEALQQIYGYMTFNNNKYGILTNLTRAWFFQRVENGRTLSYAGPVSLHNSDGSLSMLQAYVGIVLLAEKQPFHASPVLDPGPPGRLFSSTAPTALANRRNPVKSAGDYKVSVKDGAYECLDLDFHLCDFRHSTARHTVRGFTIETKLPHSHPSDDFIVMCKAVDVFQNHAAVAALETESRMYLVLHNLQGRFIPKVHGYFNVWGILRFLALEHVGEPIGDGPLSSSRRRMMKASLSQIHRAGYIHGDIARRNFCVKGRKAFVVDLESCIETQDRGLMDAEMDAIDAL